MNNGFQLSPPSKLEEIPKRNSSIKIINNGFCNLTHLQSSKSLSKRKRKAEMKEVLQKGGGEGEVTHSLPFISALVFTRNKTCSSTPHFKMTTKKHILAGGENWAKKHR